MKRAPVASSLPSFAVTVGVVFTAVWALFAIDMHMILPLLLALGMVVIVLLSGALGVWLHVRHRQLAGLAVSLLSALFLAMMSLTLLATFSVILLSLALLLVIGGVIGLTRDLARR